MSRVAHRLACLLLALATFLATAPVGAQQVDEQTLEARIDSLLPLYRDAVHLWREVQDSVAAAQAREERTPVDTIRVGPIRVVAHPDEVRDARAIMEDAWSTFSDMVVHSPIMDRAVVGFAWRDKSDDMVLEQPYKKVEAPRWQTRAFMNRQAVTALGSLLTEDFTDSPLGRWSSGPVREPLVPSNIYRELVLTPSKANQACLSGEAHACWNALGLGLATDSLDVWWSPAQRKAVVLRRGSFSWDSSDRKELYRRCGQNDQAACDSIFRSFGPAVIQPLETEPRVSLIWLALVRGGPGSYDRLLAASGEGPEAALTRASGMSADDLAAAWLEWVRGKRPVAYAGTGRVVLVVAGWFLILGWLATRSTRWRLGS